MSTTNYTASPKADDTDPTIAGSLDSATGYALSAAQQRAWELITGDAAGPGGAAGAVGAPASGVVLRLTGPLELPALRAALTCVAQRHEALRTSVRGTPDGPRAVVADDAGPVPLSITDLSGRPADLGAQAAADLGAQAAADLDAQAAADLLRQAARDGVVPLRAVLLSYGPQDNVLGLLACDLVADRWSTQVIVGDLARAYTAIAEGSAPVWDAPAPGYAAYAAAQRDALPSDLDGAGAAYAAALAHLEVLDITPDLRRPAHRPYRAANVRRRLDEPTLAAVRAAADRGCVRPVAVLLAGLIAVLARHTGQEDIALGCATCGRAGTAMDLVGPLTTQSVLRAAVGDDPAFTDLVSRAAHAMAVVDANAHLPLEFALASDAEPAPPCWPVGPLTVYLPDEPPVGPLVLRPLHAEVIHLPPASIGTDLVVSLRRDLDDGAVEIDYATDLFSPVRITRLLEHLELVIKAGLADPGTRLSALPLIGAQEREHLLALGHGPVQPVPEQPIHELVLERARQDPDAIAGISGERRMTYGELERRSAQLASYLIGLGVGPGAVVSLALDRDLLTLVAVLGVLRSGAAYTPMDPSFPAARMEFLLGDNGARVVLTSAASAPRVPAVAGVSVVALDSDWESIAAAAPRPLPRVDRSAPAFVIYTSGSTGTPKGVVLEHDKLTNFLAWITSECAIGPGARMLHCCSPVFDVALGEIFAALTAGASVVISTRDDLLDGRRLTELISRDAVTHAFCPPTNLAAVDPAACPGVSCVILAGEMVPPAMARRWQAAGTRVVNAYGPAEIAVVCTYFDCAAGWSGAYVPIGWPQPNRELRVLDSRQRLVPVGVPGEIVIAGFGVADGYLNRPELTAERFIADPLGDTLAYRTGDLGRWNTDGALEILGRIDLQVKVNGIRIELGEVEAVLSQHQDVGGAAVIKRDDTGTARLVAYIVGRDGRRPSTTSLREHASKFLPGYMVPAAYVFLDRFPVGGTGKIDHRALPAPDQRRPELLATFQEPRTDDERLIADLIRDILGIDRVGAFDSFFELGGTSLTAAALATRIDAAADVTVPVSQIHRTHTTEGLARWLAGAPRRARVEPAAPAQGGAGPLGPFPLTPSQAKSIWSPFEMVCPLTWWIQGDLDIGALIGALGDVHRRHQALHARYRRTEPPAAIIPANPGVPELRLLADAPDQSAALEQLAEVVQQPVDYTHGKVWRAALIRDTASERTLFGVGLHHIAFDGWSQKIFVRDLSRAYTARLEGTTPQWERPAPTLAQMHAEYAALRAVADTEQQLAYWHEQLRGLPRQSRRQVDLQVALAWGPKEGRTVPLSAELLEPWDRAAREHRFRRSSYFIAAVATGLRAMTGQDDLGLLMSVAKRGSRVLDESFTTRLDLACIRLRPSPEPDRDLIAQADRTLRELLSAQDLPFSEIAEELGPELGEAVIASLPVFVYQDNEIAPLILPGCTVTDVVEPYAREVPNALLVEVLPGERDALLRITIRNDLLTGAFADTLGTHITQFLAAGPAAVPGRS